MLRSQSRRAVTVCGVLCSAKLCTFVDLIEKSAALSRRRRNLRRSGAPFSLIGLHPARLVPCTLQAANMCLDRRGVAPSRMPHVERARKRPWPNLPSLLAQRPLEASTLATGRKNLAVSELAQAARERAVKLALVQLAGSARIRAGGGRSCPPLAH
jgi:hypothetical protein